MKIVTPFIFILFYSAAHATTWRDLEADDPVFQGEKCSVLVPESYGSYIGVLCINGILFA